VYEAGTVVLVGPDPGIFGSQFMIFYEDFETSNPLYPVVGTVTAGLEIVAEVGAAGTADGAEPPAAPAEEIRIETVTVVNPLEGEQESGQE
jgi:peptidyl-prolyl cis-trans isomerase B (cyclophilin B)